MQALVRFLSYNNAVPVGLSLLMLSVTAAFASSEEMRETVYDSETQVVAVDNTYISNIDLATFQPRAEITAVTEDEEQFYVSYTLSTIDIEDGVWQDVVKDRSITVTKAFLGDSIDLGLHISKELAQVVAAEHARLSETQQIEQRNVTPRIVATEYSGLIGRFMDPTVEEFEGYQPVVVAPEPEPNTPQVAGAAGSTNTSAPSGGAPATLSITLLGDSPARVARGGDYRELGVAVTGGSGAPTVLASVDGGAQKPSNQIVLDTTYDRAWHIQYEVRDGGAVAYAERYVLVGNAQIPGSQPSPEPPAPEPVQEPVPEPEPAALPEESASSTETVNEPEPVPDVVLGPEAPIDDTVSTSTEATEVVSE